MIKMENGRNQHPVMQTTQPFFSPELDCFVLEMYVIRVIH